MAIDFQWMAQGGVLLDHTGDIALGTSDQGTLDLVYSRLKAAVDGWKLYAIGAGLDSFAGIVNDTVAQQNVKKAVTLALSNQFLPSGSFTVQTSAAGGQLDIYVFLNAALVTQANITSDGTVTVTQVG